MVGDEWRSLTKNTKGAYISLSQQKVGVVKRKSLVKMLITNFVFWC